MHIKAFFRKVINKVSNKELTKKNCRKPTCFKKVNIQNKVKRSTTNSHTQRGKHFLTYRHFCTPFLDLLVHVAKKFLKKFGWRAGLLQDFKNEISVVFK